MDLGPLQTPARSTSACSPRRSCSWPPTRASSASRGSSTRWASTARCPTRCGSCTRATARRGSGSSSSPALAILDPAARPGEVPRQHLLLRRAAVVHDGARRRGPPAGQAARTSRAPTAARATCRIGDYDAPLFAIVGGTFTAIAFVVIVVAEPDGGRGRRRLAGGRHRSSTSRYRRRQGLDLTSTYKVAIPQPVVDHEAEYDSVLVPVVDDGYDEQVMATAAKLAARKRRGIHVLRSITVPHSLPIDARMAEAEAAADSVIEQARVQGGRRVSGPRRAGPRPARPGGGSSRRPMDMRAAAIVLRAAAARRRRLAVRQDARDRAGRAPVPGDHRVHAAADGARARRRGARAAGGGAREGADAAHRRS